MLEANKSTVLTLGEGQLGYVHNQNNLIILKIFHESPKPHKKLTKGHGGAQ